MQVMRSLFRSNVSCHCRVIYCNLLRSNQILKIVRTPPIVTSFVQKSYLASSRIMKSEIEYPDARKDEAVVDDWHGVKVKDVYRWMEDPDAKETEEYVKLQNKISQPFLEGSDEWKKINEKFTKLFNFPKYGCPMKYGNYYYTYINSGLQNQSVLYQQESLESEPKEFLNPNKLSDDGTIAVHLISFSEDGSYMAYALSESGSDWVKIYIRETETCKDLDEVLEKVKFSEISWTKDNKGFFYAMYPDQKGKIDGLGTQQDEYQKTLYHLIGNSQDKDVVVVEFPDEPQWRVQSRVSDCGKYLHLPVAKDCHDNLLYYAELDEGKAINSKLTVKKIIDKFEADYEFIANEGLKFYFRTNKNAPKYRVIAIDYENPAEENWETIIPEHDTDVIDWVKCVDNDKLLLGYIHDVKSVLQVNSLKTGKFIRNFDLDIGTIVAISGKKKNSEFFYNFSSYLVPGTIYGYDFSTPDLEPKVVHDIKLNIEGFNRENYKVEQIFYDSKDGTKIPMFVVRKNIDVIEPRPCLLYGYGGFNVSLQPGFGISGLMFIETFGGVLAYPNLRGGGEYGETWHDGGRLLNKQNCFDDFHAAAEYMIRNKYTSKDKLVIQGGSNGGLLVAASITQRPELYGAAIVQVGLTDMLRFYKFTIGRSWCSDYGNPEEKEHFENLYRYSPLHNVRKPKSAKEEFPATLILTADHDDRVSPLHSLKFAATLQESVRHSEYQKNPILLRVYNKAGHGSGKPTAKRIEEATDILTFCYKTLNVEGCKL